MGLCLPSSAHPGTWWQRTATTRRGFFRVETQRVLQACQRQALSCSKVQLCAQLQEDRTIIVCCETNDRRCCYLAWLEPRLQHHLFQHIGCVCAVCVCARTCVIVFGQSHVYNQVFQAVSGIYSSGGLLACDQDRSSRHRLVHV